MNHPKRREVLECGGWRGTGLTPLWMALRRASQSGVCPRPSPTALQDAAAPFTIFTVLCALLAGLGLGCRTAPPLPPADFSAPGWRVQQGQAVWKPARSNPELAGELLLATHTNGGFFIQFTKSPFALATARVAEDRWQIEFGEGEHSWRGRGEPPARFVWFQLSRALAGGGARPDWEFARLPPRSWRLENPRTGESLEGWLSP